MRVLAVAQNLGDGAAERAEGRRLLAQRSLANQLEIAASSEAAVRA